MHLQADPSLASHFLPSGYSATPPPPSASQLPPSPSASLLPTTTSPTPSLPPSASRASGAPGEPLILCLSPQDPGQSERGPQLRLGTHTPPVSFLPLPIRTCQERVYQEAVLELLTWRGQWARDRDGEQTGAEADTDRIRDRDTDGEMQGQRQRPRNRNGVCVCV